MALMTSMTAARELKKSGTPLDLSLVSAASAGHDIGKFGCMPGERVPYLHYYYTDLWFSEIGLPYAGQIAANHSTWDLELQNLSAESMLLIYADFRVKQTRENGRETTALYTLDEAFEVILSKLDNVDAAKKRRYRLVYRKLHDFEEYLSLRGVDVTLSGRCVPPEPRLDAALLSPEQTYRALRMQPSINLILPYAYPAHHQLCPPPAVYGLSQTCLENTWKILLALESSYRQTFAKNLTLGRLGEAVVLPLLPDKGRLVYDLSLPASSYLESDLAQLDRMRKLFDNKEISDEALSY